MAVIDHETCFVLRRPAVGLALSVALGMMVAASGLFALRFLFFCAAAMLLLGAALFRTRASGWMVFASVALVSAVRFMVAAPDFSAVDINRLRSRLPLRDVRLAGTVTGDSRFYAYHSDKTGAWTFPVQSEGINLNGKWERRRGRLHVRIYGARPDESFRYGERLLLTGTVEQRLFPGGELLEMQVSAKSGVRHLAPPSRWSPMVWGHMLREKAAQNLSRGIRRHEDQLAVYKALLLGYRKGIPQEINQCFRDTGTMHIFAISGLHVGMVGLFIVILLKTMGVPRDWWGVGLLPLLLLYVASTGMKSSAVRALAMASVYFLAPLFRRKPDIPSSIAFAAILILWWKPAEILAAGFIYSFVVVAFLVMAFSAVPGEWLARGEGWRRNVWRYSASLVITAVAAFIASAPLSALFFGSFSPVSLLGNLLVVPLTFCIVLSGWLAILLPFASEIFNHAALVFINGLLGSVGFLADLPFAHFNVPAPPLRAVSPC
jgi:ComEC/Rec2-related protein